MKTERYCFGIVLCSALLFCGCGLAENETMEKTPDIFDFGIKTVEHEQCEYILFKDNNRSSVAMLHKENCKFCIERNKIQK